MPTAIPTPDSKAIIVTDLVKRYGRVDALTGISFEVRRGTTTALLGGNGAGKTTTLSILLGVLLPTSGAIAVLGEDMLRHRHRVLPRMNFTSPYVDLPKRLSVRENLTVYAKLYGLRNAGARIRELANDLHLAAFIDWGYGTLSAGQRTRVSLAKALLNRPELLLLDEPTASLDPDVGDRMRSYLEAYQRDSRCTMLLATHNEGMRAVLLHQPFDFGLFFTALGLNVLYMIAGVGVYLLAIRVARQRGMLLQLGE